jgi:hypothetical protein
VTGGRPLPGAARGAFLHALLTAMCRPRAGSEAAASGKPPTLALVSPADSSSYALPYLASHAQDLGAWVPVAADLAPWATRAVHLPPAAVADKARPRLGQRTEWLGGPFRAPAAGSPPFFPCTRVARAAAGGGPGPCRPLPSHPAPPAPTLPRAALLPAPTLPRAALLLVQLRCVAVFGDADPRRSDLGALEEALPRVQMVLVPGAGRACYADNPVAWDRVLVRLITEELQAGG